MDQCVKRILQVAVLVGPAFAAQLIAFVAPERSYDADPLPIPPSDATPAGALLGQRAPSESAASEPAATVPASTVPASQLGIPADTAGRPAQARVARAPVRPPRRRPARRDLALSSTIPNGADDGSHQLSPGQTAAFVRYPPSVARASRPLDNRPPGRPLERAPPP
jgi:hypothetical protein